VLHLLVSRRRELVIDQTRRLSRVRDLLTATHPGLERQLDVTTKTGLWLLTGYVTPAEIREGGVEALTAHLLTAGGLRRNRIEALTRGVVDAAYAQRMAVPGEATAAWIIRELAGEAHATRDRLARLDTEITEALDRHPDGALIRSLPGMGVVRTAEFLAEAGGLHRFPTADALASAAGLAPVRQQSGKMNYLRRASTGNRGLKRRWGVLGLGGGGVLARGLGPPGPQGVEARGEHLDDRGAVAVRPLAVEQGRQRVGVERADPIHLVTIETVDPRCIPRRAVGSAMEVRRAK
jgi:transposase